MIPPSRPPSRHRQPSGASGGPGHLALAGRGTSWQLSDPPPNALFAEILRAARELLAVRSPLDAELLVSEMLGIWWGQQPAGRAGWPSARSGRAAVEALVGEGLVAYAARQDSPAALSLLSGIACLGTPSQAVLAERAALDLIARGVARPGWAARVGAVDAAECYLNSDAFGDRDEVVCVFSYAGAERHALVVIVDYNAGGAARDGWVTSQVDRLLGYCKDGSLLPAHRARRLLEAALAATCRAASPPVSESFPAYHAFIRARVRALPVEPGPAGPGPAGTGRPPAWRQDSRAMLAAEFLASDEAENLSDRQAASRCADHIVEYGCSRDFGRPLRVSPAKTEAILLDWVPRKVMLSPAEQHAMPHVLAAWVQWAGRRSGLDDAAIRVTLDAVYDCLGAFTRLYHDPSSFGLAEQLVTRLLPDRDLEALARRAFAFPLLQGIHRGIDLSALDPADPSDRRALLMAEHTDPAGKRASAQHIDRHLELADRLWRGDPPELWEAAERLLDAGMDRHEVLHILIDTIRAAGTSAAVIATALSKLPPEEPG